MSERWQDEEGRGQGDGSPRGRGSSNSGEMVWQDRLRKMMQNAEQNLPDGALTAGYKADSQQVVALLNRALASEWTSFLQYWHHYFMASDIHSAEVKEVFKEHAEDEYEHARRFGERIQQLGGVPVNKPEDIARLTPAPVEYGHDLRSMMEEDLVGERQAIDFYGEIIRTCGFDDNVSRAIVEEILQDEAEHADDFATLLYAYDASTGKQIESIHDELESLAQARGRAPQGRVQRTA